MKHTSLGVRKFLHLRFKKYTLLCNEFLLSLVVHRKKISQLVSSFFFFLYLSRLAFHILYPNISNNKCASHVVSLLHKMKFVCHEGQCSWDAELGLRQVAISRMFSRKRDSFCEAWIFVRGKWRLLVSFVRCIVRFVGKVHCPRLELLSIASPAILARVTRSFSLRLSHFISSFYELPFHVTFVSGARFQSQFRRIVKATLTDDQ